MGFIPEDQIARLKDSLDIVDIVSNYVELKPAGANYKGLCPFHHEKTPSFTVNRQRNTFHCFGCGEGGDAISFVMKMENLDYIGAIKFLADKNGILLEETEVNSQDIELRERLYKINSLTAKYYLRNMLLDDVPQKYLEKRGFNIKVVNAFFLGYAKNSNDLYKFLSQQGVDVEDMINLGLIGRSNNDGSYYDKFRDRLIFPILNSKQKIIGFGGRTINDNKIKYLNSPESEIFIKGDNLYGINILQKRANRDKVILVEGYMDVIGLFNNGIDYAVASLGTALTENQAKMIKRYGKNNIYIAYDHDNAGIKATLRAIDIFEAIDVEPRIVEFPGSMDPDEYVKEYGRENFEKLLKNAKGYLDYKMDLEMEKGGDKLDLIERMIVFLTQIKGNAKREIYAHKVATSIGISFESLMGDVNIKIESEKEKDKFLSLNREQQPKNGYDNRYRKSEAKTEIKPVSQDQLRIKLEKELVSKSLINRTFFELLKNQSQEFIKSEALCSLYKAMSDEYDNSHSEILSETFGSEIFKKSNIEKEYAAHKLAHRVGVEEQVAGELIERVNNFLQRERQEEIYRLLKNDLSKEEKIPLIRELADIQRKLSQ